MSSKEHLLEVVQHGVDFANRRLYWGQIDNDDDADFTWLNVEVMIRGLRTMASLSSEPVEIHMSSPGGDPYEMLRLIDEIESAPMQVRFVGGGSIMSAATWVMAVCDYRMLHKNAQIMCHDGSEENKDRHTDFIIHSAHLKTLQDRLYDIYEGNSRMPKQFWAEVCQRDLYLSAEETVRLGLADAVIQPRKRGNARKQRLKHLNSEVDHKELQKLVNVLYKRINRKTSPRIELREHQEEFDDQLVEALPAAPVEPTKT